MDGLCLSEIGGYENGRIGQGQLEDDDDDTQYKSKNLEAERRRHIRMNMATILDDAVSYIVELQKNVKALSDQLLETEAPCEDGPKALVDEIDAAQDMEANGIKV
ncbi:transcription factor DYT1-like [Syzygium oleosum]|uniref:transcription factor DYT1-like n=1 Tax=Syzygium oleosum TaxID=219896 RepID=UPI0024B9EA63|nr:transcription factor DYT1-like [Syzygium oleosum]